MSSEQLCPNNEFVIREYHNFMVEHNPADIDEYRALKMAQASAGLKTWVVRNPESDIGCVYDYFVLQKHLGFIDFEDGVADFFMCNSHDLASSIQNPVFIDSFNSSNYQRNLIEAIKRLEELAPNEN